MRRRVVITGCGLVTAAGDDLETFWSTLMRGAGCIGPLSSFAHPEMGPLSGAELSLAPEDQLPAEWAKYAEINANYFKNQAA